MSFLNALLIPTLMIILSTGCSSNVVKNIQAKQKVTLESVPSGSDVFMDGVRIGVTPLELDLQSNLSHEIFFKKNGFKSTKEYLTPVLNSRGQPFIQFGIAKDLGYYNQLSSDYVVAELVWDSLPKSLGSKPYQSMIRLISTADNEKSSGVLTTEEHAVVMQQITQLLDLY